MLIFGMEMLLKKRWDDNQFDDLVTLKKVYGNLCALDYYPALGSWVRIHCEQYTNKVHGNLFVPESHLSLGSRVRIQCVQYKLVEGRSPTALTKEVSQVAANWV